MNNSQDNILFNKIVVYKYDKVSNILLKKSLRDITPSIKLKNNLFY